MKKSASVVLMFALTPALALAYTRPTGGRMRPQLFRDRAPKVHQRGAATPHRSGIQVVPAGR
jgi:hypothetical protein